jgi:hypothetical protein
MTLVEVVLELEAAIRDWETDTDEDQGPELTRQVSYEPWFSH